ncbi:hypothetical protein ACJZAG_005777, partial [Escherichia coli]
GPGLPWPVFAAFSGFNAYLCHPDWLWFVPEHFVSDITPCIHHPDKTLGMVASVINGNYCADQFIVNIN